LADTSNRCQEPSSRKICGVTQTSSVLGPATRVTGRINGDGALRIEGLQLSIQGLADAGDDLDRFHRLHRADHARQGCEHAHGRALDFLDLAVFGKQARVARRIRS
jgi:hypothetical protein